MPQYRFSQRSIDRLNGVHPELILVASRALQYSPVDFAITEGVRDLATQELYVAQGKSRTLNSRHLTGDAIDVAAYVDGRITWEWGYYEQIAQAFKRAADELGIAIEWGAAWGRKLGDYASAADAMEAYRAERAEVDRKPFMDGPHFQRGTA